LRLPEAERIISGEGVKDSYATLNALGFRVVWHGINADDADVLPKKSTSNLVNS
jgi:hypothetical protein